MKKWVVMVAILICCLVYAIVKLSMSENQNMSQNQNAYKQAEETQSTKQINAGNTDKATPEEGSGSAATAAQVEAVTKVFGEFISALKSEDYEQIWKLTSESVKSKGSFEEFKEIFSANGPAMVEATIRPESATNIGGRLRLLVTAPSLGDDHLFFVQEDGQWKLDFY